MTARPAHVANVLVAIARPLWVTVGSRTDRGRVRWRLLGRASQSTAPSAAHSRTESTGRAGAASRRPGLPAVGLVGFLLLLGARLRAARSSGQGFFYPGGELGGGEAVWLGASFGDGGGWADFGDGGGGDGGGDGGSF